MNNQKLSIVVPLYNEQNRVSLLKKSLWDFIAQTQLPFSSYEFILVNDGSIDQTAEALTKLQKEFIDHTKEHKLSLDLNIINLSRNFGKGAALKAGVQKSTGQWLLTMDADIATDPLEVMKWHASKRVDFNCTNTIHIGSREHSESIVSDKKLRRIMGRVFNLLVQTSSNLSIYDSQCGFKLYPGELGRELFQELYLTGWAHDVEILMRANRQNINIIEQPITWNAIDDSRVNPAIDSVKMSLEILKIRTKLFYEQLNLKTPDGRWDRATVWLLGVAVLIISLTFPNYGSVWDEPVQHHYGRLVANWYASFFQDHRALNFSNLYLYGGFFEFWMSLVDKWFRWLPVYTVRKLCTALFGLLGVVGAIRLARLITGQARAGFLTGLLLILSPVFYGHMFINSKDIPFATAYIWSIYYLIKLLNQLPQFSLGLTIKLGLAMGAALGVRVGGFVLYSYLVFGVAITILINISRGKLPVKAALIQTVKICSTAIAISYIIMLLFWPWAQTNPLVNPFLALSEMSKFNWEGVIAFKGTEVSSLDLPWDYIPHLMMIQNTEVFLLGMVLFIIGLIYYAPKLPTKTKVNGFIVLLAGLFPVAYVIFKKSVLYDNYRHLLFVCPVFAIFAATGLDKALQLVEIRSKGFYAATLFLIAALFALPIEVMWKLHPHEYTYYNRFIGGPAYAFKKYESEYWGNSYLELIAKLENKLLREHPGRSFKIHAIGPALQIMLWTENSKVLEYTSNKDEADFIAVPTRSYEDHKVLGKSYVTVQRYNKNFSVIKDLRSIK